jgi:hypothetical protein
LTAFLQGRGRPADGPLDGNGRRSIYLAIRRNFPSPMMQAFDAPTPREAKPAAPPRAGASGPAPSAASTAA